MFDFSRLTSGGFYTLKTEITAAESAGFTINIDPAPKFQVDDGSGGITKTLLTVLPVMMNPNRINSSRVLTEESAWLTGGEEQSDGSANYTVSFRGLLNTWADNPPTASYTSNQVAHSIGDVVQFDYTGLIRNMNATFVAATTQLQATAGEALNATSDVLYVSLHSRAISAVADYSGTVAGTVKVTTSLAHGMTTGDTVDQTGTTDYNGSFVITVIDTTNYYITATWTNTQTGFVSDNTLHKYHATNYPNLVGAIPAGNSYAEDETATYSLPGASVSGHSGLVAGLTVFSDNTGGYTQTASGTTKVAGVAITSSIVFLFLAPTELTKATQAQADAGTDDVAYMTALKTKGAQGLLGEVRSFAVTIANALSVAQLQALGWAVCNGTTPASQAVSDPVITASTPNLVDKFIRGDASASGATGGSETDTLPNHVHTGTTGPGSGDLADSTGGGAAVATHTHTFTSDNPTTNPTIATVPPYYELVFMIKVR